MRRATVMLAAALALAACGGGAPGSSQAAGQASQGRPGGGPEATAAGNGGPGGGVPADICSLLTVAEVAGALGTDPTLTAGPSSLPQSCLYLLPAGSGGALEVVVISEGADAYYAQLTETREAVGGVADGAVYSSAERELAIRTHGVVVRLRALATSDSETNLTSLKALAAIVVARLGGGSVPPAAQITAPPLVHVDNACGLLSADDIARILETGPVAVVDGSGDQFCSYTLESTGEYLVGTYLDRKGGIAAWQALLAEGTTEHIDGLGTDAAYEAFNKRLSVQVGDQIMHVELYTAPDDKALELAKALMEVMLANL